MQALSAPQQLPAPRVCPCGYGRRREAGLSAGLGQDSAKALPHTMRRCAARTLAFLVPFLPAQAAAQLAASAPSQPGLLCRSAIAAVERGTRSRSTSGGDRTRRERTPGPAKRGMAPVAVDHQRRGPGLLLRTKAQAVAAVRALQARGVRSIDVGCMQINLMHHPNAFQSLEDAFDPQKNATYAARFLNQLFDQTRDWSKAAGMYHSATPELGATISSACSRSGPTKKGSNSPAVSRSPEYDAPLKASPRRQPGRPPCPPRRATASPSCCQSTGRTTSGSSR